MKNNRLINTLEVSRIGDVSGWPYASERTSGVFNFMEGVSMEKITAKMDGQERIYLDERGDKIDTCKEAIDSIIVINLDPLKQFIELALEGEPEDERPLLVMQTLLERAEEKIYAATEFIRDHYGEIEIEKARYGQLAIPETMLGVVFKPCDVKKQVAA